nr:YoaP domain-containing protein [Desulfuribacillus stibiiarsenatis]
MPKFRDCTKLGITEHKGMVLYYSNQCPHTEKYANIIAGIAQNRGVPFSLIKISTIVQAQTAPSPFTTYSLFDNGLFVTNEILSEKKFNKLLDDKESNR